MPAARTQYPHRQEFHDRSTPRSARTYHIAKTGSDRLELFRAAYPSLHFFLKQMTHPVEFGLQGWMYDDFIKQLKDGLRDEHASLPGGVAPQGMGVEFMPVIGPDWSEHIENWDTAGPSAGRKQRILTNWDNPAREAWKNFMCPIVCGANLLQSAGLGEFVRADGTLKDGLPKVVEVGIDGHNRLFFDWMGMRPRQDAP